MSVHPDPRQIFIIVPVYNEQAVIQSVMDELLPYHYSLVVVDDGSEPSLENLLGNREVHFLRHAVNLGQGAALQTGIDYALAAQAAYIVTFDGDGQHDPADINRLLFPLIKEKADVSFGSRFIEGSSHNMPAGRKFILQAARLFNFLLTGLYLSDAHNGLRALSRKAAGLIQMRENGMAHASEILAEVKKNNLTFCEVPVNIKYTAYATKKGQSVWSSFRIIFDIILNKLFK